MKLISIIEYFSEIEDPRRDGYAKRHKLIDVITIAVCAIICRCDNWEDVEDFGCAREEWFEGFLELPSGIPSHDTFNRIFSSIKPEQFEKCFNTWTKDICQLTKGEVVAIDGKTVRRSFENQGEKAIHIVSAWASQNEMVLGQVKVDEKSNEIKAIPELLELLNLKGTIITIDAMGCQKEIAQKIIEKQADYVLALKGNQGGLLEDVKPYFEENLKDHNYYETIEKNHGRIETRKCWAISNVDWIGKHRNWSNLKTIAMIEAKRETNQGITSDRRYYISSLEADSKKILAASRAHWGIENSLHWVLDMTFNEDRSRIRKDYGAQNFALLRKAALNLLKRVKDKRSLSRRRFMASLDLPYLLNILEMA